MKKDKPKIFLNAFFIGVILWLILHLAMLYPYYDIFTIGLILTTLLGVCIALLFFYTDKIAWILLWIFLGLWFAFQLIIGVWSIIFSGIMQLVGTVIVTLLIVGIKRKVLRY